jgi:hypothetical protein
MGDAGTIKLPTSTDLHAQWLNGLRIMHMAHSRAAASYAARGRLLGIAVAVLSTLVGTSIFWNLQQVTSVWVKVTTGTVSLIAAAAASAQTFLAYPQTAERHRRASIEYGLLRRRLETLLSDPAYDCAAHCVPGAIRQRWDRIDGEAPPLPQRAHDRAYERVHQRHA